LRQQCIGEPAYTVSFPRVCKLELALVSVKAPVTLFLSTTTEGDRRMDTLERRLELARVRERNARARVARLRRSLDRSNRRTANQVKFTLGAAMLALAESGRGDAMVEAFRRWLDVYLSRDQDRAILVGTVFDPNHRRSANDAA